jgi:hypothetical protein
VKHAEVGAEQLAEHAKIVSNCILIWF